MLVIGFAWTEAAEAAEAFGPRYSELVQVAEAVIAEKDLVMIPSM